MGIIRKPAIRLYWSNNPLYKTAIFGQVIPRNRFQLMLEFFHLNESANEPDRNDPNRDRLYKLRPILDLLFDTFQAIYMPSENIAIDESLLLWKGRLVFRQYIPLKPARFGIKIYLLCESSSGCTFRFRVYTGREDPTFDLVNFVPHDAPSR
jgi:hypothetical protein